MQIERDIQSIYDRIPPDRRLRVEIQGAFHFTFSDDGALLKSGLVRGVLRMSGKLQMDGRRRLAITTYCVHTFFDHYLKGMGRSRLDLCPRFIRRSGFWNERHDRVANSSASAATPPATR